MSESQFTISSLGKELQAQRTTAVAATRQCVERINNTDNQLNAFITRCDDSAFQDATAADARLSAGSAATLTGIPLGLKDIFSTKGVRTTCGSKILDNYVPVYDATVVEHLRAQGAVIVGKLNMDEFAMGSSNETSAAGVCRNPWDKNHVPGGSSGGSAVAVAAGQVVAALGTDKWRIANPPLCAHCGVVGLGLRPFGRAGVALRQPQPSLPPATRSA